MAPLVFLVQKHRRSIAVALGLVAVIIFMIIGIIVGARQAADTTLSKGHKHIITVYDRGIKTAFLSDAKTVGDALKGNGIEIDAHDTVEPALKEELVADNYWVNIYRARPVIVIDGAIRIKTITPYQTPQQIAKDVGVNMYPEDVAVLSRSTDFVGDGAGIELTVKRSVPLRLDLYGRQNQIRTQGKTVKEMLKEKGVTLTAKDRVSVDINTPIIAGMSVRVWREGKQTISVDEPIPFETQQIQDADRQIGYKAVTVAGKPGVKTISYEIEIKEGVEISRTQIAQIVTKAPTKQVEVVGIKSNPDALTKSKGAQYWTDSKGVSHRETYYDLNMSVVMQACGQGGYYTVRIDGVKVDRDGYVIVAANYGRYPRCSIVETSTGPAKVYDTGGFATRYPDGFDIATDWTDYNGR